MSIISLRMTGEKKLRNGLNDVHRTQKQTFILTY